MDLTTLIAAAAEGENHGHSETLFFVVGIVFAVFAVAVSVLGLKKPDMPEGTTRMITVLGAVLAVATMGAMVVIST